MKKSITIFPSTSKRKTLTSNEIAKQTNEFLENGGQIKYYDIGETRDDKLRFAVDKTEVQDQRHCKTCGDIFLCARMSKLKYCNNCNFGRGQKT